MADLKVCVVGSGGVGKSCVTIQFLKKKFAEQYDPTVEESYRKQVTIDNKEYDLEIVDTAGQEEFASFRDTALDYGDGFLLVFSLDSVASWREAQELRSKILRVKDTDKVPMVVVGNKMDLVDKRVVQTADAKAYADSIGSPYFETSAKTGVNIDESFFEVVRQITKTKQPEPAARKDSKATKGPKAEKKKKKCTVM
eukprot:Opistho-1_new@87468